MEEALACMRRAVEAFEQNKDGHLLPISQRRVTEMEAELIELR